MFTLVYDNKNGYQNKYCENCIISVDNFKKYDDNIFNDIIQDNFLINNLQVSNNECLHKDEESGSDCSEEYISNDDVTESETSFTDFGTFSSIGTPLNISPSDSFVSISSFESIEGENSDECRCRVHKYIKDNILKIDDFFNSDSSTGSMISITSSNDSAPGFDNPEYISNNITPIRKSSLDLSQGNRLYTVDEINSLFYSLDMDNKLNKIKTFINELDNSDFYSIINNVEIDMKNVEIVDTKNCKDDIFKVWDLGHFKYDYNGQYIYQCGDFVTNDNLDIFSSKVIRKSRFLISFYFSIINDADKKINDMVNYINLNDKKIKKHSNKLMNYTKISKSTSKKIKYMGVNNPNVFDDPLYISSKKMLGSVKKNIGIENKYLDKCNMRIINTEYKLRELDEDIDIAKKSVCLLNYLVNKMEFQFIDTKIIGNTLKVFRELNDKYYRLKDKFTV